MSDETFSDPEIPGFGPAVADGEGEVEKLEQTVEISDVGPCKKHIKVTVDRRAIDERFNDKFSELVKGTTATINGFRPGKAPRKVIERRFRSTVEEEVRNEVLMASLEQLATEHQIVPLSPPNLDPKQIGIPETGPFFYEFDIEVRPDFDMPPHRGLTLKRPVKTFTQKDIDKEIRRLLEPGGQMVAKEGADVQVALNDLIDAEVVFYEVARELNTLPIVRVKVEKKLAFTDGFAEDFGKTLAGARVGDERTVAIHMSANAGHQHMRGQVIHAKFKIKDIKVIRLPELTPDLLRQMGVRNEDQFQELIGASLERQLEYTQRQTFRQQIVAQLADASKWDLPRDLLLRQAKRIFNRRLMEMRSAGMSDEQISGRMNVLKQDVFRHTEASLREHFVLQKIGELESIQVEESDIDAEIDRIADRSGENARKVRARLEKDEMLDTLAAEVLERRALDLVLDNATYEDFELKDEDEEGDVATVAAVAAPGTSGEPAETPS